MGFGLFPCRDRTVGKAKAKAPLTPHGLRDATDDRHQIAEWAREHPGCAWGARPPAEITVLDLDRKSSADGFVTLRALEEQHGALPRTRTSATASGGQHRLFRTSGAYKNRAGVRPGLDVRTHDGYIIVPPSVIETGPYRWADEGSIETAPDWLITDVFAFEEEKPRARGPIREGGRNDTLYRFACSLRARNLPEAEARAALVARNADCVPPLNADEVETIFWNAWKHPPGDDALGGMNAKHAVVSWKGKTIVLTEKTDPNFNRPTFELSSIADFNHWYENKKVGSTTRSKWWLRHPERREYESVAFVPGRIVPNAYNLWRGFGVTPAPGDCSLWLGMVRDVICSGDARLYEYVIAWCADAVQNPADRPGVVLVLKGPQGTGKGTTAREFGALFGAHFLHVQHAQHLVGRFNAHLANTLVLFADECFWAGDKQHEGVLKALITEPTLPIEFKGKDVVTVPNYVRIVMASNKDWVVPAALDDRRFCVIDVNPTRARDASYFAAVADQMRNGGREALLHYLQSHDLATVNLRAIPDTRARKEQQMRSMDPVQAFWFARLNNGAQFELKDSWDEDVVTGDLFAEYARESGVSGEHRRGHETAFGMQLRKMCPGIVKAEVVRVIYPEEKRPSGDVHRQATTRRMRVYRFPTLTECREAFEAYAGTTFEWEGTGSAVRRPQEEL